MVAEPQADKIPIRQKKKKKKVHVYFQFPDPTQVLDALWRFVQFSEFFPSDGE